MTSRPDQLYEDDFFAWTQFQAKELRKFARTRPNVPLDLPHLAEEIADVGKEQRNALRSWTARIIEHLLLLEHSPAGEPRSGWVDETILFRNDIARRRTATLDRDLKRRLPLLFEEARRTIVRKMERYGEDPDVLDLPTSCPYTLDQVIGDWWPEEPGRSSENA